MTSTFRKCLIGFVWLGASALASAQTRVLDFAGFGNYQFVPQTYGDVTGLDLTWNNKTFSSTLAPKISTSDYFLGSNVAWADQANQVNKYYGQITFRPDPGYQVTLNSFNLYRRTVDVNDPFMRSVSTGWQVYSLEGQLLFSGGGSASTTPYQALLDYTSTTGFILQWGDDARPSGIDNISYTVSAVPEPGTYAMLLAGLGAVGFTARRRRAAVVIRPAA